MQKFGVAFFWAAVFGGAFGAMVFFRVDFTERGADPAWHAIPRLWLERLERVSYDWRSRELADQRSRSDDVVLVRVDAETTANARASGNPQYGMRPWSRDLLGSISDQLVSEGAAQVVLDVPLSDASAHTCEPCKGEKRITDDELLSTHPSIRSGKVLGLFGAEPTGDRPADRALMPLLVQVTAPGEPPWAAAARVISAGLPAYLDASGVVWGGTDSEAAAHRLHASFEKPPAFNTRAQTPDDLSREIARTELTIHAAEVEVPGIDPERLMRLKGLDGPIPEALGTEMPWAADSFVRDADGIVRRVRLLVSFVDRLGRTHVLATGPLRSVMTYVHATTLSYLNRELKIGPLTIPLSEDGTMRLVFDAADPGRLQSTVRRVIPAWRVLLNLEDTQARRGVLHHDNELRGKIVVFSDERDKLEGRLENTPVGQLGHAALLAQATVDVLHSRSIQRASPKVDMWFTVAFALAGAILAVAWSTALKRAGWLIWALTLAVVACVHCFVAREIFVEQQRWVAVTAPLLACAATFLASLGYARSIEHGLRDFVLRALGGAVQADVFFRVERDLALMEPERRKLTMYFSDIEGFTAGAQNLNPDVVVAVLREHLDSMTEVVLRQKGHVDKYLGDGLMAFWGAPVELEAQVDLGCEAALQMRDVFERHRASYEKRVGRRLKLRSGIDVGPMVVGEMGTAHRVNYTVMGESVSTAFRLESLSKHYHADILVSEHVMAGAHTRFIFREVDVLRLGRPAMPRRVFELLGTAGDQLVSAERLQAHVAALDLYKARKFAEACTAFEAIVAAHDDALARVYVERCQILAKTPPPETWDGAWPVIA